MELKSEVECIPQQEKQQLLENIPQQEREGQLEDIPQQEKQPQQQQQETFHVLAVDDSLIDRKILENLLRVSSYQVTCVDSGDKALEYLGLIDNLENNSNASPSTLSTEKEVSSWKDVPVVVMSSENVPSRVTMCLEEGAEEFLLKPVRLSDLEKLQPRLLKSPNRSCGNNEDSDNDNKNETSNYKSSTNSAFSKRKALSAEAPERRPKMKEVAVV
ncbi:two-component response regulator ORR9-like isoform X2 [Citrus sinensis]|uniref:two-component response regulator ORR9-like isoform X2 n=1 Tax=Citrus sinensis TaxID=2711 RepID=UPI002277873C|nr:two-component response regulator ORR9-like isoform X2 [Citrus sinensis]